MGPLVCLCPFTVILVDKGHLLHLWYLDFLGVLTDILTLLLFLKANKLLCLFYNGVQTSELQWSLSDVRTRTVFRSNIVVPMVAPMVAMMVSKVGICQVAEVPTNWYKYTLPLLCTLKSRHARSYLKIIFILFPKKEVDCLKSPQPKTESTMQLYLLLCKSLGLRFTKLYFLSLLF